ncbi:MAG: type secretion system protein GspD [Proteobacteria bacterium]|nr:type secretion system protein GspD [Pseudomonadota bacterium]
MKNVFRPCLLALLLVACLSSAVAQDNLVTLNFVNSDIESTIKAVGVITGKNFVIDPKVKGSVNIISNQAVARDLVYPILLSALRQQGFTAVENGSIVKVMPDADAKTQATQVFTRKGKSSGDQMITKVYPLVYESATQLVTTLRPLVSANNYMAAYQGNNTLVITDYADNVARISQIIESVDQPQAGEVLTIPVKYASVLDIVQTIARLLPEVVVQGIAAPQPIPEGVRRTVIVPDLRGNQLLVRSEAASHTKQIKSLVTRLDIPAASGSNINVVYLRNAEAVRLASTLKGILTGQDGGSGASASGASGASSSNSGFASTNTSGTGNSFASPTASPTTSPTTSSTTSSTPQTASVNVQVGGATVLIQADAVTNSLVITAPDHVYNNLRTVIDKLDVRRAQIYIEALIAEVDVSKATELGVQWVAGAGNNSVNGGALQSISPTGTNLATLYSDYKSKGTVSIPVGFDIGLVNSSGTFGVLATAIEKLGDGNVLSTPNLLMLDNEEAKITVGQNIPILTGSYTTSANSSSNPFQTVERKDIGIKLKIKPQVSDSGSITLTVVQEVSSIDNSVNTNGAGIATRIRLIETKVLVDDGQTIVLGGLIEDRVALAVNKVPLLGDIPWLGGMFRYETRDHSKTNLMVFLRPAVLRDAKSSAALSSERYDYIRAEQGRFEMPKSLVLDAPPKVQLPPLAPVPVVDARSEVRPLADRPQP